MIFWQTHSVSSNSCFWHFNVSLVTHSQHKFGTWHLTDFSSSAPPSTINTPVGHVYQVLHYSCYFSSPFRRTHDWITSIHSPVFEPWPYHFDLVFCLFSLIFSSWVHMLFYMLSPYRFLLTGQSNKLFARLQVSNLIL